jgi:hypothetical protein
MCCLDRQRASLVARIWFFWCAETAAAAICGVILQQVRLLNALLVFLGLYLVAL